jgi:hypothetical protein
MTKRYDEPIEVELTEHPSGARRPAAFSWRGRRYPVTGLLKYWREAGEGWDPERARDHECFRVEAGGGVYDLRFDRLAGRPAGGGRSVGGGGGLSGGGGGGRSGGREATPWRLARVRD